MFLFVAALHDDAELAGEPARVQAALEMLVAEAALVGLVPAGHKFTLYVQSADMVASAEVAHLECVIEGWSDAAAIAAGRACRAQSLGLVTAGVPVGSVAFQCSAMHWTSCESMTLPMQSLSMWLTLRLRLPAAAVLAQCALPLPHRHGGACPGPWC